MDDAIDGAAIAAARQHAARGDAAWWLGRVDESIAEYELAYGVSWPPVSCRTRPERRSPSR